MENNHINKILPHGLGFEDVMLQPNRSDIHSRYGKQIDTSTLIAKGAPKINIPIVSSNMDTVTESRMATTIALYGGIGIVHRFLSVDQQAEQVRQVKEKMRLIEENPPIVAQNSTIADAISLLQKRERGYVIVAPRKNFTGNFLGLATTRDFMAASPDSSIASVMTPKKKILTVLEGTKRQEAVKFMKKHRIEKVPVVDKQGKLIGVYTLMDDYYYHKYPNASLDNLGRLMVGAAIGVKALDTDRARLLVKQQVDILILDIAHGELDYSVEMLQKLKIEQKITVPIIAGNVARKEGVLYLKESGADGVKVGVGPGFVCETRDVAGVGVPQITAIMEAAQALKDDPDPIPIMADGGIRKPGDIAKAIAAGADSVMVGSLFAGTAESPGEPTIVDGVLHKMVRGMASASAFEKRQQLGDSTTDAKQYVPEGRTTFTPYKGLVIQVVNALMGGLRSGMSYIGAHTIKEMQQKSQFRQVTGHGAAEQRRPLG